MKHIICSYDSEKERVTIKADDIVIGTLSEIKIENAAVTIQTATTVNKKNYNVKKQEI